jgi:hypothetical protein
MDLPSRQSLERRSRSPSSVRLAAFSTRSHRTVLRERDETVASLQTPNMRSLWRAFGMVTHRWWGNKFCKRACKNAHRRENHHTHNSGWVIPRFFTFAGGACLAAAVAVAMLTLLLASANAAPSEERPVAGSSLEFNKEDGTLYIDWSGPIVAGMADDRHSDLEGIGARSSQRAAAPDISVPIPCSLKNFP